MLVVSCPFKRLLQSDSNAQTSTQQSARWNGTDRKAAVYKNANCCAQKQKITLVKLVVSKQDVPSPHVVAGDNLQTGFAIPYFLSGTEKLHAQCFASSPSPLPLFLQHRRLLI